MTDPEAYRKKLELDILAIMEEKLRKGEMDAERARAIDRMVLDKLHPPLTLEQIHQIAPTLDNHFNELTKAIVPIIQDHEEEVRRIVSEHAENLIKSGKIDDALSALREATTKAKA